MRYVDGYVLPVPKKSMAIYRRIALKASSARSTADSGSWSISSAVLPAS
jgi:uncharacterized protein YbaA (DUF1428 family)